MRPIKFIHHPVKRVCACVCVRECECVCVVCKEREGSCFIQLWDSFLLKSRKEVVSSVDWQSGGARRD